MAAVMIGVDPHKASHTAVAINGMEAPLGELRVRASAAQAERLVAWAASWPERTWAVEGAGRPGYLLAQQLVAAGERVLDVQPKLGAAARGARCSWRPARRSKNDPNDARSVAIAALRSASPRQVRGRNHAAVLKVWSKRHRDLGRTRTQVACRCTPCSASCIPGGIAKEIVAAQAANVLEGIEPSGAVDVARCELAAEFLDDLRRIDAQLRDTKKRLTAAVRASGTTLTEVFGVGPVIAATVIGYVADASRFPSRDNFAAYNGTAPTEVSSGNRKIYRLSRRGNRRLNHAIHMAAVTRIRHPDCAPPQRRPGLLRPQKLAGGKTPKEALRSLKRRISDAIYARLQADARRAAAFARTRGPGGRPGNDSVASAAGSHPGNRLFGPATPEPATTLRPPNGHSRTRPAPAAKKTRKGS